VTGLAASSVGAVAEASPYYWNILFAVAGSLIGSLASVAFYNAGRLVRVRRQRLASDEAFRKLEAKKLNEHIKLLGSFCNTVGAAIIGAAFIVPYIGQHTIPDPDKVWWVGVGLALPLAGHVGLRFMKSE
jgi:membrane protein YqaA with SNARE-associated domain